MKLHLLHRSRVLRPLLAFAAVAVLGLGVLAPEPAQASEYVACVKDADGNVVEYFTDVSKALWAGYGRDRTLVLLKDWNLGSTEGTSETINILPAEIAIDLNGHTIKGTGTTRVFHLDEGAILTLKSTADKRNLTFADVDGDGTHTVSTGGLITGGGREKGAGVYMEDKSHLTLEGVSLAGNQSKTSNSNGWGAGVYMNEECVLDLKNGAAIQFNKGNATTRTYGGGVYVDDENATINIDGSQIADNYASLGGGIYSGDKYTRINLKNGGAITQNNAGNSGGGLFFASTFFYVVSDKAGDGEISWNSSSMFPGTFTDYAGGGGIFVDTKSGENEGLIKGVKINYNSSEYDGGGLELDQEWTKLVDCELRGNTSDTDGGAIFVNNDNIYLQGCTIQENTCNKLGDNYEGGGVFVSYKYDLNVSGTCIIKGNTRYSTSSRINDDVFLSTLSGGGGKAYIQGNLAAHSSVGVRTGVTGDRMLAKNFTHDTDDCLFSDFDDYYVSYGSDHDGDAWQRKASKEFSLKVDGVEQGRYKQGSAATAAAKPAEGTFLWKWDADKTTGLNPFDEYIADWALYLDSVSFDMPQCDVNLVGVYGDKLTAGKLFLEEPVAGKDLPATATFERTDEGRGFSGKKEIKLAWYKAVDGGEPVAASGVAEYGATYFAEVAVDADRENGLVFSDKVSVTASTGSIKGADVRADGSLLITTGTFATAKPTVESVEGACATVQEGVTEEELRALLPTTALARTNAGTAVALGVDTAGGDLSELIDDITRKVIKPADGKPVTVNIPLKASSEVTLPSDKRAVAVTVTVTEKTVTAPDAPTVTPGKGTYPTSTQKLDEQGRLKLEAACGTQGSAIRYRLCKADGEWTDSGEQAYEGPIYLQKKDNDQCLYDLEIWSVKDGAESEHLTLLYVIDDTQYATVTVDYTDTAIEGHRGSKKSEAHSVRKGESFTVVAPDREGYRFEKWTVGGEDRTGASLTLEKVDADTTVTAVYNPVVTELDVDFAAPVAHDKLAASATVRARAGGSGEAVDITGYFEGGSDGAALSWAPEGDGDGKAEHMTAYTASLALKQGKADSGVKYVLSDALSLRYGGNDLSGAAYTVDGADGAKRLCVLFESTGPLEEPRLASLDNVELTHEEAWGHQTKQDAGGNASWGLPKEVTATCKCGCGVPLEIEWEKVTGFDKGDYGEQGLAVKGEVSFPSYVDNGDGEGGLVSGEVSATIHVAAAEKVGSLQASIPSGRYNGTQQVSFACETEGATIRYTTDGSEPTEESPVYDGGWIEVAESTSFKVKAFRDGWKPSDTLELAYTIVHDVTFDSAGGSAVKAQEVEHGKCAGKPADPVLAGCTFEGWYAEGADAAYDFDTPVTADLELTARWSRKGEPVELHAVTFDSAGGTEVPEQHVAHGGTATRPADPELDGFEFEGWLTDDGDEYDFSAKVVSDVALHASWSRGGEPVAARTVTFDSAGGSAVDAQTVADGACAKRPAAPTLAGFDFEGWSTADGGEYDFSSKVTSDITLYARWSANGEAALAHLVVFDSAGGSAVPAQTVEDGETVERPADPKLKGFKFEGWYAEDSEDAYDFKMPVTGDLILYARWSKSGEDAVAHLVTFDSAGGTPVASQSVDDGKCAERPADPTRPGYDFAGWTLDGRAYDFTTPVKADLKLTATWKKKESKKDDTEKGDSKDGSVSADDQKANATKTTTTVTTTATSGDAKLAATGDRAPLAVAALVLLGLLAAAAGIAAERKKK